LEIRANTLAAGVYFLKVGTEAYRLVKI